MPLELGQTTETVQVEAAPVQVETNVTQMGTIMENQQIVDLPILNRDWLTLQQLVPGAVGASDRFGSSGGLTFSTNGQESQQNSFLVNGADTMDLRLNQALMVPSEDAIGEFNLIDSTINPEYGRNSGAIMNVIMKSGTNEFHGSAFEFYRDTFLNTRNFFQPTAPVFHQNQFGGVLDGPIVRNHLFFMISYQGTYNRSPDDNVAGELGSGLHSGSAQRLVPGYRTVNKHFSASFGRLQWSHYGRRNALQRSVSDRANSLGRLQSAFRLSS